ncbi:MAG: DUF1330 domain-containing protein [Candidatus Omnitrophica bacterium]|nr:DUF1330 domain-containing protein [Candidatus Omnitrophota bacterium]
MSVYMIIEIKEIIDEKVYGEYVRKVSAAVIRNGGKYLVRGGRVRTVSGDWNPNRIVLIEFESMDKFNVWCNSPENKEIVPMRARSAKTNAVIVEGIK